MMKKLLLSISAIAMTCGITNAQQLQNSSFETFGAANTYTLDDPQNWGTLNFDAFGFPQTTMQSSSAPFHGSSNLKLETKTGHSGIGIDDVVGGAAFYNFDVFGTFIGTNYTTRPLSIAFEYKSNFVNSDTAFVYFGLSKWDGAATNDVGGAFEFFGDNQSTWTHVNIPIAYLTGDTPDSLMMFFQCSAGSWPYYVSSYPAQAGSVFEVDAIVVCEMMGADFTSNIVERTVDFTSSATTTGIPSYSWDFGDGSGTSTDANPTYEYAVNGTYDVSLTVTDSCGNDSTIVYPVTINSTLSVNEFLLNNKVNMYPNPASSVVNISVDAIEAEDMTIELYDLAGRRVETIFSGIMSSKMISLNTDNLNDGSYHVVFSSASGTLRRQLIVRK